MRWSWFIFVILPWVSDGYRILCLLPYAGKSHHMVFEPLLAQLAARGHQLTVVSFFPAPPQPRRRDVSLAALAPLNVEVVDLSSLDYHWFGLERYFESAPTVIGLARANLEFCEKLLDADIFQEFVQTKGDYDLILTEHFNSDCMLGIIHKYGVPSIGLQSCAMLPWTYSRVGAPDNPSYVPVMTLGLTDDMTFGERIINAIYLYSCLIWMEIEIRWKEQRLLESKLGKLPPLGDIARNASLVISNTHHALSGNRVVPPAVLEVGGIHLHNRSAQPLPRELEQWVSETAHGFILFSFGSLVRGASLPAARLAAIAAALARLPQRVLWKWEAAPTAAAAAAFPHNVRTERWLPQYDLLNHPNCVAFITHGGLLSLTEAVSAGVPMMMVPILGDQFGNAAHAKKAGIAEVLRLQDITEESLHTALLKILSPAARAQAKRMRDIWMDRPQPPMDTAVFHIERVARHKLTSLSSEARWLNTLQLLLLDVLAFFVVIIGLPVYLIVKLISKKSRRKLKQS